MSVTNMIISPPVGGTNVNVPAVLYSRVLAVIRKNLVYNQVAFADLNNGYPNFSILLGKIRFPTAETFEVGEKIIVLYKIN